MQRCQSVDGPVVDPGAVAAPVLDEMLASDADDPRMLPAGYVYGEDKVAVGEPTEAERININGEDLSLIDASHNLQGGHVKALVSRQLGDGLVRVIDQVVRPAGEVGHGVAGRVEAEVL